jgi:2,3-bisphosphoglycerate-dependent phosphoglycerate mutase
VTRILLVRHAEPVAPSGAGEENERPLTLDGAAAAAALAESIAGEPVTAVYSSPYQRAVETARPIAAVHGLDVEVVEELRERLLSPAPCADWYAQVRRTWDDFDYALPGGESCRAAQVRAVRVLGELAARHPGETIVAASHGNLIALALHWRDPGFGFDSWEAMQMPALYEVEL